METKPYSAEELAGLFGRYKSMEAEIARLTEKEKCPVCGDMGCSNCRIDLARAEIATLRAKARALVQRIESMEQPINAISME